MLSIFIAPNVPYVQLYLHTSTHKTRTYPHTALANKHWDDGKLLHSFSERSMHTAQFQKPNCLFQWSPSAPSKMAWEKVSRQKSKNCCGVSIPTIKDKLALAPGQQAGVSLCEGIKFMTWQVYLSISQGESKKTMLHSACLFQQRMHRHRERI
jgi:hypothetical protein